MQTAYIYDDLPRCAAQFTGKERDTETGLDYFGARYYGNAVGRFASPDPKQGSAAPVEPQSWNRYVYVLNNPVRFIDPDGLEAMDAWYALSIVEIANFWRTYWLPTGRNFAAFSLLAGFSPAVTTSSAPANAGYLPRQAAAGINRPNNLVIADAGLAGPMCPWGCSAEYSGVSARFSLMADFKYQDDKQWTAVLSLQMDPRSGQMGKQTKWSGSVLGPRPDTWGINVRKDNIASLSDAKLSALQSALSKELSKGFDLAMWESMLAVDDETEKRSKQQKQQ